MSTRKKPQKKQARPANAARRNPTRQRRTPGAGRASEVHTTTITNIKGSAVAVGTGASAQITHGVDAAELAALFEAVYRKIEARPEDPDVDREELASTVEKIQTEAARGEEANPNKVERWLKFLAGMAPDIFEVAVATLTNPAAGVATVIRKIAEKAKAEAAPA